MKIQKPLCILISTFTLAVLGQQTPVCTPPPSGITGWWAAQNNTEDSTGLNPDGIIQGNVTYGVGMVGQTFVFNGNGSAVMLGNPADLELQNFTIEGWIQRATNSFSGGNQVLFGCGNGGYSFVISQDGILLLEQINGSYVDSPGQTITDTNWHHVAVTKTNSTVVFYTDGTAYSSQGLNSTFTFGTGIAIGAEADNSSAGFYGSIDGLAVYNRALSTNELLAIFNASSAGKCPSVVPTERGGLGTNAAAIPANQFPYTTATGVFGFAPLSPFSLGFMSSTNAGSAQGILQLVPGYNVQPYNSELSSIGGLAPNSGNLIVGTGTGWGTLAPGTQTTSYLANTGPNDQPAWSQVNLSNGVTGNLSISNLNNGTGAASNTFWRGDGTWAPFSVATTNSEIWITPNGNGGGSGTPNDPFSTPTADSFFTLINDERVVNGAPYVIPPYAAIHLMPGTFQVHDGRSSLGLPRACLTPKTGWKIRGAGIDSTIIQIIPNHPKPANGGGQLEVIAGNADSAGVDFTVPPDDDVEVSDLTIDCNLQSQTNTQCMSAVNLQGSNDRVSRVRAINWGSTISPGYECFVFYISGSANETNHLANVVEDCIVEQPAPITGLYGATALGGDEIRGCIIRNISTGSGPGQLWYFHGFSTGSHGVAHDNLALNVIGSSAAIIYADSSPPPAYDVVYRNNTFLNVNAGIEYVPYSDITNFVIRDNLITVSNGGAGIILDNGSEYGNATAFSGVKILDNTIVPAAPGYTMTAALVLDGNIEFQADDNILDCGGGAGHFDFRSNGGDYLLFQAESFRNNHNNRGQPLALGSNPYDNTGFAGYNMNMDSVLNGFDEESLTFTPTSTGWYKVFLSLYPADARVDIQARDQWANTTDLGLAYHQDGSTTGETTDEITLLYNDSTAGVGGIPQVRLAHYPTLGSAEQQQVGTVWPHKSFDILVTNTLVSHPITIRVSGMLRSPPYISPTPYLAPTSPDSTVTLNIGPGIRTTGSIYSGNNQQELTDPNSGLILAGALPQINLSGGITGNLSTTNLNNGTGASTNTFWRGDGQWASVNLTNNVTGSLSVSNLNAGNNASSNTYWRGDGTWAPLPASPLAIKSLSDQSITGTNLTGVTNLAFSVGTSNVYAFEFFVTFQASATNSGIELAVNGPTNSTLTYIVMPQVANKANATTNLEEQTFTVANGTITTASIDTANTNRVALIKGNISTGATAGNVTLMSGSSKTNGVVTIKTGSWATYF